MKRILHLITLCALIATGCTTDKDILTLLDHSEQIQKENPDSALTIMRSINPRQIHGKEDMMRYRLLYSEAAYYNRIVVDNDSLTLPLISYYYMSNEHDKRARALYQHALIQNEMGKTAEAIFSLMEAAKSLRIYDNPRLAGLVHRTMGIIYHTDCLFKNALEEYKKAKEYFDRAGLVEHSMNAAVYVASALADLREFDQTISYLKDAEEELLKTHCSNQYFKADIILLMCLMYIEIGDFASCEETLKRLDKDICKVYRAGDYKIIDAILDACHNNYSSAKEKLSMAANEHIKNPFHWEYAEFVIEYQTGNYADAVELYKKLIATQDKNVFKLITNSILHDHILYLEKNVEQQQQIISKNRKINALITLIFIGIIAAVIYVSHNRAKQKQAHIATLREQIDDVNQDLERNKQRYSSLQMVTNEQEKQVRELHGLYSQHLGRELKNINDLLDAYYSDQTKSVKQKELINAIDSYVNDFANSKNGYHAVELYVNESLDNIMEKLRLEIPNLKECDYRLLCLVYANFSSNAMCLFLDYDKNKLYKRKSKLKAIISSSNCANEALFIKNLR